MNAIICESLVKYQGKRKVLNGLTFHIKENTITGLVGPNGAGKTTLMKIIAGYCQNSGGQIKVFGKEPFDSLDVSANTIYASDDMNFMNTLSLMEILQAAGDFYEKWDMDLAMKLFDYFSFDPSQIFENLSKGGKCTFSMIFALASRCSLTLMDEPTTGMDKSVRDDFYRALLKDYLAHPRTIIIASHYLDEVENLLEDILLLDRGQKRLHLPIDEVKEYALEVTGDRQMLTEWAKHAEVLAQTRQTEHETAVIVKSNLNIAQMEQAKKAGFSISHVSPSELCVYLTKGDKRGIDHVFDNR